MFRKLKIPYVGFEIAGFTSGGLPRNRDVLCLYFHIKRTENKTARSTAVLVAEQIFDAGWRNTRIPILKEKSCVDRVVKLHSDWTKLTKNKRPSTLSRIEVFKAMLDNLFDISQKNAIQLMKESMKKEKDLKIKISLQDDIDFLLKQSSPHFLRSTIKTQAEKEPVEQTSTEMNMEIDDDDKNSPNSTITDDETIEDVYDSSADESIEETQHISKNARGTTDVITAEVVQALDAAKVSNYQATVILAAAAKAFGIDVSKTNINEKSIRVKRCKYQGSLAASVRKHIELDKVLTAHWDGKIVRELSGKGRVERQAIVITGKTTNQQLGAPAMDQSTGKSIAKVVVEHLQTWGAKTNVKALCFDTTAVNSGWKNGAAVWIERILQKNLLWLPCRHHILEIVLGATFNSIMGKTTCPEVPLFKRFHDSWNLMDSSKFTAPSRYPKMLNTSRRADLMKFAQSQIDTYQPRDDYKELLELVIIFLGGKPLKGLKIRPPGPMHHARWMNKAIYSIKLWLFRDQAGLNTAEKANLFDFSVFVCSTYVKFWYTSFITACAPKNDLMLIKALKEFSCINTQASETALQKMANHLWYLSPELLPLAIFDENLEATERRALALAIVDEKATKSNDDYQKKCRLPFEKLAKLQFIDLASSVSSSLFEILQINKDFLLQPVETWQVHPSYQEGRSVVTNLGVTNDAAERGVKFFQDYNGAVTKNETSFQNMLVSISEHRRSLRSTAKRDINRKYALS